MTLDGTNTWLVGEPSRGPVVVVDPGPLIDAHLDAVIAAAPGGISAVLLTHRHLDHSEAAPSWPGGPGAAYGRRTRRSRSGRGLADGDRLEVAGATLTAVATPGHTSDSVSLLVAGDDGVVRLLSGDTVLGRGTTVITHPDGDLAAYLDSLARLRGLVAERGCHRDPARARPGGHRPGRLADLLLRAPAGAAGPGAGGAGGRGAYAGRGGGSGVRRRRPPRVARRRAVGAGSARLSASTQRIQAPHR